MYEGNCHFILILTSFSTLGGARGNAAICGFFINYILFFGFLRSFSGRDLKLFFFQKMCVNCSFKSFKVIINPIVQTYNVSYMGASSLPGACCLGMTIGMALGPLLVSKASLRRLTYIVSWIPAGCWLLMYFILDFKVLIISFLIMARFFNVSAIISHLIVHTLKNLH